MYSRNADFVLHTTHTVSRELSSSDKALLGEEGVSLPERYHRKRKSRHVDSGAEGGHSSKASGSTALADTSPHPVQQWEEVKQYLDPNPQLKGVEKGKYSTKVRLRIEY